MGIHARKARRMKIAVASVVAALAAAGSATAALQALPPGDQVNNDSAAGINPALPVSTEDPANSDVTGGSLAGGVNVPWAVFRQTESGGQKDQVFSRSFAAGKWTTRGIGTVGGRSSASPTFSGSLNFDQGQDGEAPVDRLRRRQSRGAVGDVVREDDRHSAGREQHLREPLRQHHRASGSSPDRVAASSAVASRFRRSTSTPIRTPRIRSSLEGRPSTRPSPDRGSRGRSRISTTPPPGPPRTRSSSRGRSVRGRPTARASRRRQITRRQHLPAASASSRSGSAASTPTPTRR